MLDRRLLFKRRIMPCQWPVWLFCCSLLLSPSGWATNSLTELSGDESASGLRQALEQGASVAVAQLGKPNGYYGNPKVHIPLPVSLEKSRSMLGRLGMATQMDQMEQTMNKAAEAAVVEAKPVLVDAVKQMSVADAKTILSGGETAATDYFRRTTSKDLTARFLPIVKKHTDRLGIAKQYSQLTQPLASLRLVSPTQINLDGYVTDKALEGLFLMVAEEEKAIRQNPLGQSSTVLQKVFSALQKK